jgi:alkylhydroperoxidase/carboxymuconolactone decarboxylase family protein YurZ
MIYLFCGDDNGKKISSYEKFIKSENTEIFSFNRNNFDRTQIESLYSGSSLFSNKSTIILSDIFEYEETRNFILDKLKSIAKSDNSFVFLEGKLNKNIIDLFKKNNAQINIFELPKKKLEKFDNFLIANAFANRDKFNTWMYFRQAMDAGVSMEEVAGVLFWKIKDMILKKNFGKFKEEQLKTFAAKLSYLLPEARKEGREAESTFEQFLLEAF